MVADQRVPREHRLGAERRIGLRDERAVEEQHRLSRAPNLAIQLDSVDRYLIHEDTSIVISTRTNVRENSSLVRSFHADPASSTWPSRPGGSIAHQITLSRRAGHRQDYLPPGRRTAV